jgi:GNAT superfamily N-acetyltransferase
MTDCRIRPARPADVPAILRLIRELARFERAEHAVKATEADLLRDGWGAAPRFEALIAERAGDQAGGAVVGFALFFHTYSTWEGRTGIFIEDLYVAEGMRGHGIGGRLVAAIAAIAVARGCPRLDLNVLDWNPARAFYHRLGLAHLEEWLPYRITGAGLHRLAASAGRDAGTGTDAES